MKLPKGVTNPKQKGDKEPVGKFKDEKELDQFIANYIDKKLRDIWVQRLFLLIPWLLNAAVIGLFIGLSTIWKDKNDTLYWFMISFAISALLRLITVTVNMFSRVKYNDKKMKKVASRIIESYFLFKDKSFKSVKVKSGKFKPLFKKNVKKVVIQVGDKTFSYDVWERAKFSFLLFFIGFIFKFVKIILKYIRVVNTNFLSSKYVVSQEAELSSISDSTKSKFKSNQSKLEKNGYSLKGEKVSVNRKKTTWASKGLQVTDIQIQSKHKQEMKKEIYKILDNKLKDYKEVMLQISNLTY